MTDKPFLARRRQKLHDTIRKAAKELMDLEGLGGFSFPFGDGRQVNLGIVEKPEILFDTPKGCVVVDGKECYTADELWVTAWEAQRKVSGNG